MDDLIQFLRDRLDQHERTIADLRARTGEDQGLDGPWKPEGEDYVLLDIKSKRTIVELHGPANPDAEPTDGYPGWPDKPWFYCKTCGSGEPFEYPTDWPCETLKLLAQPWAGHPEFRESWRP